jgi:putative membrane protein
MRQTLIASVLLLTFGALAAPGPAAAASGLDEHLSDAQIATFALAALTIDINRSKVAAGDADNAEVRELAERMISAHTGGKQGLLNVVSKLRLAPDDSLAMQILVKQAARIDLALGKLAGPAFDRAYLDAEIAHQKSVLDTFAQELLPRVRSGELKRVLTDVDPSLRKQLAQAQHVQKSLR